MGRRGWIYGCLAAAVLALGVAACGGDDDEQAAAGSNGNGKLTKVSLRLNW